MYGVAGQYGFVVWMGVGKESVLAWFQLKSL